MKRIGKHSFRFENAKVFEGFTIVGPKENAGNLANRFDVALEDDRFAEKTFEAAECKMFQTALEGVLAKSGMNHQKPDVVIGGDLLNQNVAASFSMRAFPVPYVGIYNACGTFVEALLLTSVLLDGGFVTCAVGISGSHFSTAERQYRYPLELGVLRSPVSQWTATGVGATLLTSDLDGISVTGGRFGRVVDLGVKDANNMGAAMAPAALDTLQSYFEDTHTSPRDYDAILTGDLGMLGKDILKDLARDEGIDFSGNYDDCGAMLFKTSQKTFQGGSGAACSAIVFNSYLLPALQEGRLKRVLLVGTGALMSPLTSFQGESIPCIAHLIEFRGN